MKMIFIAAATLMTGASVYGLYDYNKRSGTREFENLYRDDKTTLAKEPPSSVAPVVKETDLQPVSAEGNGKPVVKEVRAVKKTAKKKRKAFYKNFSRAEPVPIDAELREENQ